MCLAPCVHQSRFSIDADVGLPAEVPLISLRPRLRLQVALTRAVLRRARRRDRRGVDCRARLEQQALVLQQSVDHAQHAGRQVVLLGQVPQGQDRGMPGVSRRRQWRRLD